MELSQADVDALSVALKAIRGGCYHHLEGEEVFSLAQSFAVLSGLRSKIQKALDEKRNPLAYAKPVASPLTEGAPDAS